MKKIAFAFALIILMSPVLASEMGGKLNHETTPNIIVGQSQEVMDCTFSIKGTFDGVAVDLQITVYDVSWVECGLLKLGVKDAMK